MRKMFLVVVGLAVLIGVVGCINMFKPQEEGILSITIKPSAAHIQSVGPKLIPANAEYVKIFVWHPDTGFFTTHTALVDSHGTTVEMIVPINDDYVIDVVSYLLSGSGNVALTGDRATGVSVAADATSNVNVTLAPWEVAFTGDSTVTSGEKYSLTCSITGGGGLIEDGLSETFLSTSLTSFQDPSVTRPAWVGYTTMVGNGTAVQLYKGTAPEVPEEATLYVIMAVDFVYQAYGVIPEQDLIMLELPNRFMGETIHQITVTPPGGGIVIGVE